MMGWLATAASTICRTSKACACMENSAATAQAQRALRDGNPDKRLQVLF
ncbi:MAG: hypothetical protein RL618_1574 [Pseudomonadota bacterium]